MKLLEHITSRCPHCAVSCWNLDWGKNHVHVLSPDWTRKCYSFSDLVNNRLSSKRSLRANGKVRGYWAFVNWWRRQRMHRHLETFSWKFSVGSSTWNVLVKPQMRRMIAQHFVNSSLQHPNFSILFRGSGFLSLELWLPVEFWLLNYKCVVEICLQSAVEKCKP